MELLKTVPPVFIGETDAMFVEHRDTPARGLDLRSHVSGSVPIDCKTKWMRLVPVQPSSVNFRNGFKMIFNKIGAVGRLPHLPKRLTNHILRGVGDDTTTCNRIGLFDKMIGNHIDLRNYAYSQTVESRYNSLTYGPAAVVANAIPRAYPDQQIASWEAATVLANRSPSDRLDAWQAEVIKADQRMLQLHAESRIGKTQSGQVESVQGGNDQARLTATQQDLAQVHIADVNLSNSKRPRVQEAYLRQKRSVLNEHPRPRYAASIDAQANPSVLPGTRRFIEIIEAVRARFDFVIMDRLPRPRLVDPGLLAVHSGVYCWRPPGIAPGVLSCFIVCVACRHLTPFVMGLL